ncbi:venom serine protease inhibitor-like [Andrena cerasifolii]|uniref:venom serine protease inhibitor-like n=1 Tax=Andrena cerasifolii TaxID=2819439 RepID=UPI004037BCC1
MSRTFITLFLILAISSVGILSQEAECPCGRNEVWSPCNGHCPPTCDNQTPACPKICVPGCICKPGYLKSRSGVCVPQGCCNWND